MALTVGWIFLGHKVLINVALDYPFYALVFSLVVSLFVAILYVASLRRNMSRMKAIDVGAIPLVLVELMGLVCLFVAINSI